MVSLIALAGGDQPDSRTGTGHPTIHTAAGDIDEDELEAIKRSARDEIMDVGTISIVLVIGLVFLLGIGMPLGFASAVLGGRGHGDEVRADPPDQPHELRRAAC